MKYIRTKDKILPALKVDTHHFASNKQGNIIPDWSVKQADTIEELCDEYVSVRDKWHDHWTNFEDVKILCSESEIYGAIWTDKGLIYVAKMNDKGEFELL